MIAIGVLVVKGGAYDEAPPSGGQNWAWTQMLGFASRRQSFAATRLDALRPSDTNEHDSSAPQTATNRPRCFARTYESDRQRRVTL